MSVTIDAVERVGWEKLEPADVDRGIAETCDRLGLRYERREEGRRVVYDISSGRVAAGVTGDGPFLRVAVSWDDCAWRLSWHSGSAGLRYRFFFSGELFGLLNTLAAGKAETVATGAHDAELEEPQEPGADASLDEWFDYYHLAYERYGRGYFTLEVLAKKVTRSPSKIRQKHCEYLKNRQRGVTKLGTKDTGWGTMRP